MQLPIDFKALIDEMTSIGTARETELSVSVYVDESAPADLVAHVRSLFASTLPSVRMELSYLDGTFVPRPLDDMAIVVAGASPKVGAAAAAIRSVGVPAMVATTLPATVERLAREGGHAIPDGDIAAPCEGDEAAEPFGLDEDTMAALDERMGDWVVSACRDKQLALSIAFPFLRRSLANDVVQLTSLQNAGIGLVPIIPGADMPIITLNQAKMVLQVAAAYGHDMSKDRAKELLAVVGGAYLCRALARQLVEFVPVLGFIVRPGIAYGGTAAMGYAIIEYFEGGQNVAGVASAASHAAQSGAQLIATVREKASRYAPAITEKVSAYAPKAMEVVSSFVAVPKPGAQN